MRGATFLFELKHTQYLSAAIGWSEAMQIDEFHDFEAYAGSLQHLDLRVTLPRRRQSLWKLGQVQFKGMSLRCAYGHELTTQAQAVRIIPDPSNRVRAVLQRVAAAVQANPQLLNEAAAVETVHAELLKMARQVLKIPESAAPLHSGRPVLSRKKIIEIALDAMKSDSPALVSVTKLATAVNLSERTLRSVFHEYFGMGPLRYMKARQLTSARNDLRKADPASATVASIAAKHGIWELGKFAHEYSGLFGERPSETLRSNR